jgi:lysozyme
VAGRRVDGDRFYGTLAALRALGVPGGGVPSVPSGTTPAPRPQSVPAPRTYVVVRGDTLSGIAGRFWTSVAELVALDGIANWNLIYVGQRLRLPGTVAPPAPSRAQPGRVYVVRRGDTLSGIAARFGTSVRGLAAQNGIRNVNLIYVGQVLHV